MKDEGENTTGTTGSGERWAETYQDAPRIFGEFTRAQDPEGHAWRRLRALVQPTDRRVLEVGSGTGRATWELAPGSRLYVAVEPRASLLAVANRERGERTGPLRARGEHLPFPARSFDVAVATWVLADLRPDRRERVLAELSRVLRPDRGGAWLLENHWSGELQELRGRAGDEKDAEVRPLLREHGFALVEVVPTELRFSTPAEAERVLGHILGERARAELRRRPRARLGMNLAILHRDA